MSLRLSVLSLIALALAGPPAFAGGPSAEVTRVRDRVEIKPLARDAEYRRIVGHRLRIEPLRGVGRWRLVRRAELVGLFLLRTGGRAWVHLNGSLACVEANSLLRIDSGCGYSVRVLRGRVTAVDGRSGKSLGRRLDG